MFKSKDMIFLEIYTPKQTINNFWDLISQNNNIHIVDNNDNKYLYLNYFKRLDKLGASLENIKQIINLFGLKIEKYKNSDSFLNKINFNINYFNQNKLNSFDNWESYVINLNDKIEMLHINYKNICLNLNSMYYKLCVFSMFKKDFQEFYFNNIQIKFMVGKILGTDIEKFNKILFRITRGNMFIDYKVLKHQNGFKNNFMNEDDDKEYNIFYLTLPGFGEDNPIYDRIKSLFSNFNIIIYNLPETQLDFEREIKFLKKNIMDNQKTFDYTQIEIFTYLKNLSKKNDYDNVYDSWIDLFLLFNKFKYFFENLNKIREEKLLFIVSLFLPSDELNSFEKNLARINRKNSEIKYQIMNTIEINKEKTYNTEIPSYFVKNIFIDNFSKIVFTYGYPKYKEINPVPFTVISFPFLFGVMFGDIFHGLLLFWFGIYLTLSGKKVFNKFKYLALFVGFFSWFSGLIYNDFTSIPFDLWNSCYNIEDNKAVKSYPECNYGFGFDPIWYFTKNEIAYMNSFKMKISIIFGVIHMTFGIILKGFNYINFKKPIGFLFDFLPQFIFFFNFFGYLVFIIFKKWLIDWNEGERIPPSIISYYLSFGFTEKNENLYGDSDGVYQSTIQNNLFMYSLLSIPILLFVKPLLENYYNKNKKQLKNGYLLLDNNENNCFLKEIDVEEEFGDIFVHQMIETIEFIMGSISNTASYLRLWALSWAHSQLSKVILEMTVLTYFKEGRIIMILFTLPLFLIATFLVLMIMDLMECFLHTLRLHWVEFQNKFYKSDGLKFRSLKYDKYLNKILKGISDN